MNGMWWFGFSYLRISLKIVGHIYDIFELRMDPPPKKNNNNRKRGFNSVLVNITPSSIFPNRILLERFHHNYRAALGLCEH